MLGITNTENGTVRGTAAGYLEGGEFNNREVGELTGNGIKMDFWR
jgi:hypothetical protein